MQPNSVGRARIRSGSVALVVLGAIGGMLGADRVAPSAGSDSAASKPVAAGRSRPAEKLPEVIRNTEGDDVDGRTRAPAKAPSKPDLTPAAVDALITQGLTAAKATPAPPLNDEEFIRRVYLDVIGGLPTPGSIHEFATARPRDKRAKLIDALLDHPDYAENWARYWRDVIQYRSPNENDRQANYPLFEKWLGEQFAANTPWDKIATAIITATGRNDENGATAFALAEEGMPVEMAGEVSRIFLGVQIQCAQCHDHPSDPWKRQQFHEFAAFFAGVRSRRAEKQEPGKPPVFLVSAAGNARYTMPDLKDPARKIPVAPKFFLGDATRIAEGTKAEARLALAAQYVTSPENPWFARAFVNRVWYCLLGESFYNPVDDLGPTRTPNAPELLDLLADDFRRSGHDIKRLFRIVLNTEAYQRKAQATNTSAGRTPFAANCASRLRADQIFDSLGHALDMEKEVPGGKKVRAVRDTMGRVPFNNAFGVDPSTPNSDVLGTIPQALALMNGPIVARGTQARADTMLGQLLATTPDNRTVLDILYLRTLARKPTAGEVRACGKYLDGSTNRAEAFEDILWALLNSTEFISRK